MSMDNAGAVAGAISTGLFMTSYLPMLVKAFRTRDLRSYSLGSLAVTNAGNLVHTVYIASLPVGPIWVLHGFSVGATGLMTYWWYRYRRPPAPHRGNRTCPATQGEPPNRPGASRREPRREPAQALWSAPMHRRHSLHLQSGNLLGAARRLS
jgi:hypothetical protein